MNPLITAHTEYFEPGTVRVDVVGNHLPEDFLGIAFDLVIRDEWRFEHSELCGGFEQQDRKIIHLTSSQPGQTLEQTRLIFGLTVTEGGYSDPQDGCMARFYFHSDDFQTTSHEDVEVLFERTTLSIYKNGRRDLADVQWEGGFLNAPESVDAAPQTPSHPASQQVFTQQTVSSQQYDPFQTAKADLFQSFDAPLLNVYMVIFAALALAMAIFFTVWLYYRLRRKIPEK